MIKMEIRSFTLFFSKRRAKERRNVEEVLQHELSNLQRKICLDPSEENVCKFYNIKFKLNQLSLLKTKAAMTRSKACWCEQGERNSKYLFCLERRNHSTKYISELKLSDETTATKPKEILNEEYRFYKELYTSNGACPDVPTFRQLFSQVSFSWNTCGSKAILRQAFNKRSVSCISEANGKR